MFLASEPKDLKDFLQACNFLAPEGSSVEYFIVPAGTTFDLPQGSGFVKDEVDPQADPALTEPNQVIVYSRQKPIEKIAQGRSRPEYLEKPQHLPKLKPVQGQLLPSTDTLSLGSPFVRRVESTSNGQTVVLLEDFGPFPRNTLFRFERTRL
jgi:hypothetical protein